MIDGGKQMVYPITCQVFFKCLPFFKQFPSELSEIIVCNKPSDTVRLMPLTIVSNLSCIVGGLETERGNCEAKHGLVSEYIQSSSTYNAVFAEQGSFHSSPAN